MKVSPRCQVSWHSLLTVGKRKKKENGREGERERERGREGENINMRDCGVY